jgi:hypothetical protein
MSGCLKSFIRDLENANPSNKKVDHDKFPFFERKELSFKEKMQLEQDKRLLRTKKQKITKKEKKKRRLEGAKEFNKNMGLKKIELRKKGLFEKNKKFLEESKRAFKVKESVIEKIISKITNN